MTKVIVTGANGFIGKNLIARLSFIENIQVVTITRSDSYEAIREKLKAADFIFHLAGVNRSENAEDFRLVNMEFTKTLVQLLENNETAYTIVFTSSTQAADENVYGLSKRAAENILSAEVKKGKGIIYRLPGVFGKWCRPDYNSVVATFCHNVAYNLPLFIRDENFEITLVYVDDVVNDFISLIDSKVGTKGEAIFRDIEKKYLVTLGIVAKKLNSFKQNRNNLFLPDVGDEFEKALYSTYLSYLSQNNFSYKLQLKTDNRGSLYELLKTENAGQIFISTTYPGITRGNHFHHTKTEKFLVIQGQGIIRFKNLFGNEIIQYEVNGDIPEVVDIPPGYTHNISNTGSEIMITLFWANEVFNPENPDTYFLEVENH